MDKEVIKRAKEFNDTLANMEDEDREEYIISVLKSLDKALDDAMESTTARERFAEDIKKNGYKVVGCLLYSIEDRYRQYYAKILGKITRVM